MGANVTQRWQQRHCQHTRNQQRLVPQRKAEGQQCTREGSTGGDTGTTACKSIPLCQPAATGSPDSAVRCMVDPALLRSV
jgi:hypothetical protein